MLDALDAQKLTEKIDKGLNSVIIERLGGVAEADLVDGDHVIVLRKRLDYATQLNSARVPKP